MISLEELQTMTRLQLAEIAVGRMPPFKPELREKVRKLEKTQTRRAPVVGKARYYDGVRFMIEPLIKSTAESISYPVARYKDDGALAVDLNGNPIQWRWEKNILTSIHMPNEAARFFVNWRHRGVEHLHDISRDDAKAEGVSHVWEWPGGKDIKYFVRGKLNPFVANYSVLWDRINADRDGLDWDSNPYVHVYEWEPISQRIWSCPVVMVDMPEISGKKANIVIGKFESYRKK